MSKKILIADDDLDLCEALALRFEAVGLESIVVDDSESAMWAVACEQPDAAIMDVRMPTADGDNVFDLLATRTELSELPVIILTGCRDEITRRRCENLSAHYVPKGAKVWQQLKPLLKEMFPDELLTAVSNRSLLRCRPATMKA